MRRTLISLFVGRCSRDTDLDVDALAALKKEMKNFIMTALDSVVINLLVKWYGSVQET